MYLFIHNAPKWRSADRKTAQKSSSPNINPSRKETRKSVEDSNGPERGLKQKPFTVTPKFPWNSPLRKIHGGKGRTFQGRIVKLPECMSKSISDISLNPYSFSLFFFLSLRFFKTKNKQWIPMALLQKGRKQPDFPNIHDGNEQIPQAFPDICSAYHVTSWDVPLPCWSTHRPTGWSWSLNAPVE